MEPKIIANRICMPSPMDSVRAGMKFFLAQAHIKENTMDLIFHKQYQGFESTIDIGRDMQEMLEDADVPAEFTGTMTITVTYTEEED